MRRKWKQGRRKGWATVNNSRTSPAAIARAERMVEAVRLRGQNYSYPQISRAMGIGVMTAYDLVDDAIAASAPPPSEEEVKLELLRLDAMSAAIFPAARQGNARAIRLMLRVMDLRAAYLGLDREGRGEF
jgi:hypothetical protein